MSAIATAPVAGESSLLRARSAAYALLARLLGSDPAGLTDAATVTTLRKALADVAGFYRAFGLTVIGDRPDHVVAQLEFLALAVLAEAEAIERGDLEHAQIAASAVRSFLRDHIGGWIDAWAARVGAIDELTPWFPYAAAAADLVRSEAANRNVIPVRDGAALPADAGLADDEEAVVACESDEGDALSAL